MKKDKIDINTSFIFLLEQGDTIAFEALFKMYYDKLTHLAKNYLVYHQDAEEIVQNIFLKLWEQKNKLKTITNINNYLYTMTKNACLDHLKHEKIKRNFINSKLHKKTLIHYQFLNDEAASLLLENELEQRIIKSIELLPKKCKKIFIKSRIDGLRHKEIAKELGISVKTVDNHISKAIKHMKLHLKDISPLFL